MPEATCLVTLKCDFCCLVLQSPERTVVKVDHAVVAGLFTDSSGKETLAASQRQITGYLVDSVGNVIRKVSQAGKPDKVYPIHSMKKKI